MHITLFSFVTAVLLSSLLIVALYLSRKSVKTIRMLNFGYLACLYLFCLGRLFFSVCRCDLCAVTNESTT